MPLPSNTKRGVALNNGRWSTYRIFGVTVASGFDFVNRLAPGSGSPDLVFACIPSAPLPGGWEQAEPAYASPPHRKDGKSGILLYRSDECWIVRFHTADFYLWHDCILCHLPNPEYRYLVEIQLLGVVLACWLEWRGTPALHASAVALDGHAAAFLSAAGGGKSSLALALMQGGYPLLTDDCLPIEGYKETYVGHPGYPQIRMWPDQAMRFLGQYEDLDIVHPAYSKRRVPVGRDGLGGFCDTPQPLACLYLPERRDPALWGTRVEITPVSRREGLVEVVRRSFAPRIVEAMGLQPRRLRFFASLVSHIPVRRVVYPEGHEYLPIVRCAILDDLGVCPNL